ncbi:MAG TPA: hypothetical protein VFL90_19480 [Methylomirabilota bacterium]|nr:hypothetical protein [Methylomirabilota bacterium]
MPRLYFMTDGNEMVRRRARVPKGSIVEAWPDMVVRGGSFWVGEDSKTLLDAAGEAPMTAALALPAEAVPVFYGPQLGDLESLPREESLRARVLSARGVAVAWITLDRFGQRISHEPKALDEPIFHLRRPGGGAGHVWRLFRSRAEAIDWMREAYGEDSEGAEWARMLPADDFEALLARHGAG